jgi:hypothetical protein
MNKYSIIGGSLCVIVLLILGSMNNLIGYQTVQAINQKTINYEVNKKELLFQTIFDMANNKEIQKVILGSVLIDKISFEPKKMRFLMFTSSIVIKRQLNIMLILGAFLLKMMGTPKLPSFVRQIQPLVQKIQQRIIYIIGTDVKLNDEIIHLSDLNCHCDGENVGLGLRIICGFLFLIMFAGAIFPNLAMIIIVVVLILASILQCPWTQIPDNPLHL